MLGLFLSQGVISHSRFTSQVGCKSISFFANSLKSLPLQTDLIKSIPISFVVCFNPLVNPIILDHKPMVDWLIDWLIDKINLIHSYWCKYIKSYSNLYICLIGKTLKENMMLLWLKGWKMQVNCSLFSLSTFPEMISHLTRIYIIKQDIMYICCL